MKESVVEKKSYQFSLRIVKLYQYLLKEHKEYVLSKQVLKSGTAIGAIIREAEQAESTPDFIHQLSISLKEAKETEYWLSILKDTDYIDKKMFDSINEDCDEVISLLTRIIKTTKANLKNKS
ncbi:MAG: four helix bundle protein [Bacteroidales bacterium]|nr:four helix bundle protein [Bacteroidales bacterium]